MPKNGNKKSKNYRDFKLTNEIKSELISIEEIEQKTNSILEKIKNLPVNEIKYYLLLILKSLENKDRPELVNALLRLTDALTLFMNSSEDRAPLLKNLSDAYENLRDAAELNTLSLQLSYALINLGSALLAFITGILSGLIGGAAGFFRSLLTFNNPIVFLADGFATGAACGASLGFRAPKKLLKDELTRQLKLCIDSIADCIETIAERKVKPISYYEEKIKSKLLKHGFANNEQNLLTFLESEQTFAIETVHAQFISEHLDGFLGHHARISIPLPNQINPKVLEFSPDPDEIDTRPLTQIDKRRVSGKKLVEMMALHEQLLITEPCPTITDLFFSKMKVGERDCLNYVNKILVATNQNVTSCRRFDGSENWVGRNIIGFFVQKLSPFSEDVLDSMKISANEI